MSDHEKSIEFASYCEPAQVSDYLEALSRQLLAGEALLSVGGETLELRFETAIKFELRAEVREDKGKYSLEIELTWRRPQIPSRAGLVIASTADASSEEAPTMEVEYDDEKDAPAVTEVYAEEPAVTAVDARAAPNYGVADQTPAEKSLLIGEPEAKRIVARPRSRTGQFSTEARLSEPTE
jgi:amphi-Trp domain-containing protein